MVDISQYNRPMEGIKNCQPYAATGAVFLPGMAEVALKGLFPNQTSMTLSGRYKLVERFDKRNKG